MVRFLIHRPIAVIMVFIAVIAVGVIFYRMLPVALMPNIDIPEITIQISYPQSAARDLENTVIKPIRSRLEQVNHLNDLTSETSDGRSIIRLSFEYGSSIDYAFIEVNEKIDAAMNQLPRDMERPRVIKASATDIPVFYLNVSLKADGADSLKKGKKAAKEFLELSEFCESVIRRRIEQLPEIALVDISGTSSPEILIKPDKNQMGSLNISLDQLKQAIEQSNISPANFMVKDGYYQYHIRFSSYLKHPEDIGNIYLRIKGKLIKIKDIATITLQERKAKGIFMTGDKQGITMAIIQQSDAQMSQMKQSLSGLIDRLKRDYPYLDFEIAQDQSQLLEFSISNLSQNVIVGSILAFLVLFLFLRDLRAPLLIGVTVPLALIISFLFFKLFNLSINIISLSGLALGIGMIIDCSIIVIDNITQHFERSGNLYEACVSGTSEVIRPMLSSTLTTSSVFLPLIFMSGIAGALFYDEAVSISIGNAASFIVSITILPVLFALAYKIKWKKSLGKAKINENSTINRGDYLKKRGRRLLHVLKPETWYEYGLKWTFKHKIISTCIFIILLLGNFPLFKLIRKEKLPTLEQRELILNIDWNENIHLDENKLRVQSIIQLLKNHLEQSNSLIGEQEFMLDRKKLDYFQAEIYLKLKGVDRVDLVKQELSVLFKRSYPFSKINFKSPENIFERIFTNNDPSLIAKVGVNEIENSDPDNIVSLATEADRRLNMEGSNIFPFKWNLTVGIDQEKLMLYGVSYNTIYQNLKSAFNENDVTKLKSYQHFLPVLIGEDQQMVSEILATRKIKNDKGEELPLSSFLKVNRTRDFKYINADQKGEYIPLNYEINESNLALFQNTIKDVVREKKFSEVFFGGTIISNGKMFKELTIILVIAVMLLYFILAAQFESLLQPLIVLLEIPIDIAGALFTLWIFGDSLNIMSAIGIIIMSGVIINDSILKVDTINQLRKEGLPLEEAIKRAGILRLRSILMTALTTILAILPFFISKDLGSELQRPLSLALIGGMTVGTLVSLFFIPLAYWWIYNDKSKVKS